jgi:hypothetical protein
MSCSNNLKQIGLALHNYENTLGFMPPWAYDFDTNPNPKNPLGNQLQGHGVLGMLLPYIEQENAYRIARPDLSVIDPNNWPPSYATKLGATGTVSGQTRIKTYLCPSAPARELDYQTYFTAQMVPNLGPFVIAPTDYAAIRGITTNFKNACASTIQADANGDNGVGALGVRGFISATQGLRTGKLKITDMSDGTSNTILFSEDAGRHQMYARGVPITPAAKNGDIGWLLNGAWADYNTAIRLRGFSADGKTLDGGCCVINCNNANQVYAFHSGGAQALRGDGSVQFIRENIAPGIFAALLTRAGGEVVTND